MKYFNRLLTMVIISMVVVTFHSVKSFAEEDVFDIAGFKVGLEDYFVKSQGGLLEFKGEGSIDLSPALGAGAVVRSDEVVLDSSGNGVFKNVSFPGNISMGGVELRVADGDISFSTSDSTSITIRTILILDLAGTSSEITADLPFASGGIQDTTIDIKPAPGQDSFFSQKSGDAEIALDSGTITIRGGKFSEAKFTGSLKFLETDMTLRDITVASVISGSTSGRIVIGNMSISLGEGMDFSYSSEDGFKAEMPTADVDISRIIPGAKPFQFKDLTYEKSAFSAEADLQQTIGISGAELNLTHVSIESEKNPQGTSVVKAEVDGSIEINGVDISFEGLQIDSGGSVSGVVKLPQPKTLSLLGLSQTVDSISFSRKDGVFSVGMSGSMAVGSDVVNFTNLRVSNGKLSGDFDVSESKPLSFSWMPGMKMTAFNIENDALKFSGRVDIPDPFKYTFEFRDVEVSADGRSVKSLVSSTRDESEKTWKRIVDPALITLENVSSTAFEVGGFKFQLDAITIPNPIYALKNNTAPDTLMKLFMRSEIPLGGSDRAAINVDGIEFTKAGLKDLTLNIAPPPGTDAIFSKEIEGVARLEAASGMFRVKGGKLDYFGVAGIRLALPALNISVTFDRLDIGSDGELKGNAKFTPANEFTLFGIGMKLTSLDFSYGNSATTITMAGSMILGDYEVPIKALNLDEDGVSIEYDVSEEKPVSLSWLPFVELTQLSMDNEGIISLGGSINLPSPIEYTFSFEDVFFNAKEAKNVISSGDKQLAAALSEAIKEQTSNLDEYLQLVNTNEKPLEVFGATFYLDAVTVINPIVFSSGEKTPDVLFRLYMRSVIPIEGKEIPVNVYGLELGKDGLRDLTLDITAPEGEESLFEATIVEWAEVGIESAQLVVKSGKFESFTFKGKVGFDGKSFDIESFTFTQSGISGTITPDGDPTYSFGGFKLNLGSEISFSYEKDSPFSVSMKKAAVDMSDLFGSSVKVNIEELTVSDGSIQAEIGANSKINMAGFKIGIEKVTLSSPKPEKKESREIALAMKNVSIDLSELFGSNFKVSFDKFDVSNGSVAAEMNSSTSIEFTGFKINIEKIAVSIPKPAEGKKREVQASFDGSFSIPAASISLEFKDFKVSSSGGLSGTISPPVPQAFSVFGMSFAVTKINVAKKTGEALTFDMDGTVKFGESARIDVKGLGFNNGKIRFKIDIPEDQAISLPYCSFVKLSKFEAKDNVLTVGGFMDVPIISVRLIAQDVQIDTSGTVLGGTFKLGDNTKFTIGLLTFNIKNASFDIKTKYLKYSASVSLPQEYFSGTFEFNDMGLLLARSDMVTEDMSKMSVPPPSSPTKANKAGFPLKISKTGFGIKDSYYILTLSGSLTFMNKFQLNFENLKLGTNKDRDFYFKMGTVSGSIQIAGMKVEINEFVVETEVSDPYVRISGGLTLPSVGSVKVTGLTIYKSGSIELKGLEVGVDKGAYKFKIMISYENETFKGAGAITLKNGVNIDVAVLISPKEFKFYIEATGLNIVLFPGITLDGLGGGIHCIYSPLWMEFKLTATMGIGNANLFSGKVTLIFNTDGVITVSGEFQLMKMFTVGKASITIDIPNKTLRGSATIIYGLSGIISMEMQVEIYFSPSTWYVSGTGTINVVGKSIGNGYFKFDSSGAIVTAKAGFDIGLLSGTLDFYFRFASVNDISLTLKMGGTLDLVLFSASASLNLSMKISNGEFNGSADVSGCFHVYVPLPVVEWCDEWFGCPCCALWGGWNSRCWSVPYPCGGYIKDVGFDKCATIGVKVRISSGGVSISK